MWWAGKWLHCRISTVKATGHEFNPQYLKRTLDAVVCAFNPRTGDADTGLPGLMTGQLARIISSRLSERPFSQSTK